MAVVAVLLGTVVAANLAENPAADRDPRASFTFETDNDTVVVTHFGGDELDPANVYVESGVRGLLGNFDGSEGMACMRNLTHVRRGSRCHVPNSTYERLYVVWQGEGDRTLILARRGPDPTPTPTPTRTPTVTATPVSNATATANETATPTATGTATGTGTPTPKTPTPNGTTTPGTETPTPGGTATPDNGTATPEDGTSTPVDGTATPTNETATPGGTPTPTGTPADG